MSAASELRGAGEQAAAKADRLARGEARELSARELLSALQRGDDLVLVDVRSEGAFARGHLPGAIGMPYAKADPARIASEVAMERPIVVYCYIGVASAKVACMLEAAGFADVRSLAGGHTAWRLLRGRPADERGR